ncbi:hypothetical protein AB0H49_33985 [Nocardia sp. NPDC050713]|uniref:hypothetical protein n=1 Tax=Nocardia sp. NPDC050713 TaxID=3154511 RepID=UPI00341015D5
MIEYLLDQGFVTPLPRSGGTLSLSRKILVAPRQPVKEGAPRRIDKKGRQRKAPAYDEQAELLASRVKRDERFPLWVRQMSRRGMAAVLTPRVRHGWTVDDVFGGVDALRVSGKRLQTPRNPYSYLAWILGHTPVDEPPALLERARDVAEEEEWRAAQREQWAEIRANTMAAAAQGSPGWTQAREVAQALGQRTAGKAAARARELEESRRELARRARS